MRSVDSHKMRVVLRRVSVLNSFRLPHSMRSVDTHKVQVVLKESLCFEFV